MKLNIHWKATAMATAAPRMVFGKISAISTQHADRPRDEQRFTSPFLDCKDSQQREQNIDDTHDDGLNHRVAHSHRFEDTRCEIEYGVDTYRLLEYTQHDTDKDNHPAISEKLFRLFLCRGFDLRQNNLCLSQAVDTA